MDEEGIPPDPVLEVPPPSEIRVLESAEDIQVRKLRGSFITFHLLSHHIHFSIVDLKSSITTLNSRASLRISVTDSKKLASFSTSSEMQMSWRCGSLSQWQVESCY